MIALYSFGSLWSSSDVFFLFCFSLIALWRFHRAQTTEWIALMNSYYFSSVTIELSLNVVTHFAFFFTLTLPEFFRKRWWKKIRTDAKVPFEFMKNFFFSLSLYLCSKTALTVGSFECGRAARYSKWCRGCRWRERHKWRWSNSISVYCNWRATANGTYYYRNFWNK